MFEKWERNREEQKKKHIGTADHVTQEKKKWQPLLSEIQKTAQNGRRVIAGTLSERHFTNESRRLSNSSLL